MPRVRPAASDDAGTWLAMREALWPEGNTEEHASEIASYLAGSAEGRPAIVLLAEDDDGTILGFAELAIRPYAEGCNSSRVAYLEGWYTVPSHRRSGVGAALVRAAEDWGREMGCTEFASDADPANQDSIRAHRALGFEDAGLITCFRKDLKP